MLARSRSERDIVLSRKTKASPYGLMIANSAPKPNRKSPTQREAMLPVIRLNPSRCDSPVAPKLRRKWPNSSQIASRNGRSDAIPCVASLVVELKIEGLRGGTLVSRREAVQRNRGRNRRNVRIHDFKREVLAGLHFLDQVRSHAICRNADIRETP